MLLSIDSHDGASLRLYVMLDVDLKVCRESVYEKGSAILATGGSWELNGKVMAGWAALRPKRLNEVHNTKLDAIVSLMVKSRTRGLLKW